VVRRRVVVVLAVAAVLAATVAFSTGGAGGHPARASAATSPGITFSAPAIVDTVPITNTEAQGGITPIVIDGVCCINAAVAPKT
jgi:hypothetical protein